MKKTLIAMLSLCLVAMLFVACDNAADTASFKDGTYKAAYAKADDHGWTDYLEVTVADGKITEVDYDSLNADGAKKSENDEYNNAMKNAGGKTWPSDFFPKLEKALIEKQNAENVDAVAGATSSSDSMKKLYKALIPNMQKGDTAEVKVD